MKTTALLLTLILLTPAFYTSATPYRKEAFYVGVLLTVPLVYAATTAYKKDNSHKEKTETVKQFKETIAGKMEFSVQQAFAYWEEQCKTWKEDVQKRTGKRLKSVNCGDYKREIIDADTDAQRFVSQGSLVFRVKTK